MVLRLGRCPERPLDPERGPVAGFGLTWDELDTRLASRWGQPV
jgi:hypothetical protein